MRILEGGTDAASMLLFDPEALPDDYDQHVRDNPIDAIERLSQQGRIFWLETGADGSYTLGVCLEEPLPDRLAGFARPLGVSDQFAAPGGLFYFTGTEYAFRRDDAFLRKYPHMGSTLAIPPGTYRLEVHELEYPEGFHETTLREGVSAGDFRLFTLMNALIPLGCLGLILLVLSVFALGTQLWSSTALPLSVVLILPALVLSRSRTFRTTRDLYLAIQRDHPDYLARLSRVEEAS